MHIRVTTGHFDPAKYDELLPLLPDIATAIQRLPGCQDYRGGADRTGGRSISVSTFDTLEHAQFSRDALGDALIRLLALGIRLDPPQFYEDPGR